MDGKSIDHGKNMDGKYRWQVWMASTVVSMDGKSIDHGKNMDG